MLEIFFPHNFSGGHPRNIGIATQFCVCVCHNIVNGQLLTKITLKGTTCTNNAFDQYIVNGILTTMTVPSF